jgi:hypothetical protein
VGGCRELDGSGLGGTVPTEIGTLTAMTELCVAPPLAWVGAPSPGGGLSEAAWGGVCRELSNNKLTGTLPTEIGQLTLLTDLCVHRPSREQTACGQLSRQVAGHWERAEGSQGRAAACGVLGKALRRERSLRSCLTAAGGDGRCRYVKNNVGLFGWAVALSSGSAYSTSCTGLTGGTSSSDSDSVRPLPDLQRWRSCESRCNVYGF